MNLFGRVHHALASESINCLPQIKDNRYASCCYSLLSSLWYRPVAGVKYPFLTRVFMNSNFLPAREYRHSANPSHSTPVPYYIRAYRHKDCSRGTDCAYQPTGPNWQEVMLYTKQHACHSERRKHPEKHRYSLASLSPLRFL